MAVSTDVVFNVKTGVKGSAMSNLRQTIQDHAAHFAEAVVQALRGASLEELMSITGGRAVPRSVLGRGSATAGARGGRLGRRSPEDIHRTLGQIVAVLAQHPEGLRAEQLKAALQLDKRELPRPLAEGLGAGTLRKEGNKRATTYFLSAGGDDKSRPWKRSKRASKK
jgi:hypothetical protein